MGMEMMTEDEITTILGEYAVADFHAGSTARIIPPLKFSYEKEQSIITLLYRTINSKQKPQWRFPGMAQI